ncbi:hypothetical protein CYMTET_24848 [Cymbomonas tetramitiformis]|uniref:PAP-associated domain-containing protein n=1 Tax=Cymbomonas tetramitiformis TaxID=36881 RepID=A0AAE0FV16_9CHLO|nr:hypothetical protein CYMTET_24848 [Cymbomonas tetramitiformis]
MGVGSRVISGAQCAAGLSQRGARGEQALRQQGAVQSQKIMVIGHARVPIIKFKERSGFDCDISMGSVNGLITAKWIRAQMVQYPPLAPLCVILKRFLLSKYLNDTRGGGVGGFLLVNLVLGFLMHVAAEYGIAEWGDLGGLLHSFFVHYANFDYANKAVAAGRPERGGVIAKKELDNSARLGFLGAEDPQEAFRDIGGGSHRYADVRRAMCDAARQLAGPGGTGLHLGTVVGIPGFGGGSSDGVRQSETSPGALRGSAKKRRKQGAPPRGASRGNSAKKKTPERTVRGTRGTPRGSPKKSPAGRRARQ